MSPALPSKHKSSGGLVPLRGRLGFDKMHYVRLTARLGLADSSEGRGVLGIVLGGIIAVLAVGAWAALVAPSRYRLVRRTLGVPGLPAGLHGLTILHISDLHFRRRDSKKLGFIRSLARHPADLVCVTGDLTEDDGGHLDCIAALSSLKGAQGTYAVLGSHDYHWHCLRDVIRHFLIPGDRTASGPNSPDRLVEGLQRSGVRVLRNESLRLEVNGAAFRVVGLDDPYLRRHDLAAAMNGAAPDEFKILFVHTPEIIEEVVAAGVGLVLTGHTHGGQVRLPGIGALVTHCSLPARLASGAFTHGRTVFHLNNGIGFGSYSRLRFFCPPEATLLTIVNSP